MLIVKELTPFTSCFSQTRGPLRVAQIRSPRDALSLPWITSLPGDKQIRFFGGQIFVMQRYLGCNLVRADITRS
jgi:hypothetical protein